MGALTLYAIKSALCLAVLFLPFTLLLRRATFFAFNRCGLLLIVILSLLAPCLNVPLWDFTMQDYLAQQRNAIVEVGMPVAATGEPSITAPRQAAGNAAFDWVHLLVYTYIVGFLTCLVLKAIQLYRLLRFIPSGCLWTDKHEGAAIYCHAGEVEAFSWMRSIVVGEADSSVDSPVLLHEMAHVRHHHSWDALFVAIVEVLQWFNPCIWMLDTSLREIHEYEADDAVLRRGISARNYQLLLIKNAVRGSRYAFANAFNHSLLKKRITMMMKKKSNKWARLRLLYVVPATLIVLGAFASRQFVAQPASPGGESQRSATPQQPSALNDVKDESDRVQMTEEINKLQSQEATSKELADPSSTLQASTTPEAVGDTMPPKIINGKEVYGVAEVMPEFPGGMSALMTYLSQNVHYPAIAAENGVQGRYVIRFCITSKGKVTDVEIARKPEGESLSEITVTSFTNEADSLALTRRINEAKAREAMEAEALRVISSMPDWTPGYVKGNPINCLYNLPISFRLQ